MSTLKWGGQDVSSVKWGTEDVNEIKWVDNQGVTTTAWTSHNPYFDDLEHLDLVDIAELPPVNAGGTGFFGIYSASHRPVDEDHYYAGPPDIVSRDETTPIASYSSKPFNFTKYAFFISLSGYDDSFFDIHSTSPNWNYMVVHNPALQVAVIFRKDEATLLSGKYRFDPMPPTYFGTWGQTTTLTFYFN